MAVTLPNADRLPEICRRWHVSELALFGSAARGEMQPDSDIDLLVSFDDASRLSSFDFVGLQEELAAALGKPVDLIEAKTIVNPIRRAMILKDKTVIYAA